MRVEAQAALVGIALLEALNYAVHVVLRPEPWNITSVVAGYALWAVQLACFARLQLGDPGSMPASWESLAEAGTERAEVCARSGRLVPPRARYSKRAGTVVLGLDHYCHWLGTPVGFGNRKLFILFVGYSALFCAVGSAHSACELCWGAPARLGLPSLPGALRGSGAVPCPGVERAADPVRWFVFLQLRAAERAWSWLWRLLARAHAARHLSYIVALLASVALNMLSAVLLFFLMLHQVALSAFNRTTLEPTNPRYDRGVRANWEQVFGRRRLLWALPLLGGAGGPEGDGIHWTDSERWEQMQRRARATAQEASARARGAPVDKMHAKMLLDPATQPPLPPGARGRWALDRHRVQPRSLAAASISALNRLRALAKWWESRLCCGVMTIGSLRLVFKLRDLVRQRAQEAGAARQRNESESETPPPAATVGARPPS